MSESVVIIQVEFEFKADGAFGPEEAFSVVKRSLEMSSQMVSALTPEMKLVSGVSCSEVTN